MNLELARKLGDQASEAFKHAQKQKSNSLDGFFGLARVKITAEELQAAFNGESIDLADAQLIQPTYGARTPKDLFKLLNSVNRQVRDANMSLGEPFLTDVMILAAHIGSTKDLLNLPLTCTISYIHYLTNIKNLKFTPGALIPEEMDIHVIGSLNSTGMGTFLAVPESKTHSRIYYYGLNQLA